MIYPDFMVGKKFRLPSSADTLTERGMVERSPLSQEALYESQVFTACSSIIYLLGLKVYVARLVDAGAVQC